MKEGLHIWVQDKKLTISFQGMVFDNNFWFISDNPIKNNIDRLGYRCPNNFNPADYYIDVLAIKPKIRQQCLEKSKVSIGMVSQLFVFL